MIRTYAALTLIALAACSSSDTKYDYSKCGEPVAITVTNEDILDGDPSALALPKAVETDIALRVTDAEGDLCDPRDLEIAFDDESVAFVVSQDEDFVLMAKRDAIDSGGTEPTTAMHATLGNLSASWTVTGVVALGGTWNVVVTEKTRYPTGFDFGEVIFTQLGRRLVWEDCSISIVCSRDAVIRGAAFTAEAPEYGLMISAPIDPDRNGFAGPWSAKDGDYEGDFIAVRLE